MRIHVDLPNKADQEGIGLIEILVALLLLAVAALGYSALQARAMAKTDESLSRTQAINLMHSAVEMIRVNAIDMSYKVNLTATTPNYNLKDDIITYYKQRLNGTVPLGPIKNCLTNACTQQELATYDIKQLKDQADSISVTLGMDICPGTTSKGKSHCIIAAWKNTEAKIGAALPNCIKSTGAYNFGADCVYMEAY